MKAAVYYGAGDIRLENVPDPVVTHGELLLEIHAAGICGTDAGEYVHGPRQYAVGGDPVTGHRGPLIPGHELSGRVVAAGAGVEGFTVGTVVASGAGISCGACEPCRRGRTNLCRRYATVGLQRNGALAQFCAVPASICVDVEPFGLDEELAALAQPMSVAVHALRRGRLAAGEDAVVIGCGGIGAFLTYAAAEAGARVAVVELSDDRLALARALGAHELIRPNGGVSLRAELEQRSLEPTVIYEATGSPAALAEAIAAIERGGRLVAVGMQAQPGPLDIRRLTLDEVELIGTNAHVFGADLPEALRLLAARGGSWTDVAPAVLPLSRLVAEGIEPIAEGRSTRVKTLIDPWATTSRLRATG